MSDAHAKAVEAAAEAFEKTANGLAYTLRHAPSEIREWAMEAAITAYLAAMRAEGWVMVRVPSELSTQMHPDDMDEDQIEDADWRYAYEKMVEGVAAMLKGAGDGQG